MLLTGDNRAWEFSAWERTIHMLGKAVHEFDAIHFVTSAFNTLYTDYLGHFRPEMLASAIARRVSLGHIDSYSEAVRIAGRQSASWMRTCFFFLPPECAVRVATWAPFSDPSRFFVNPTSTIFKADAPISEDYRHRIRIWLEGHEVGGNRWHSPIRSGEAEADRFQRKTLAIVNEHYLSITLREMGVPLVDFCWLWSQRVEDHPLNPMPPKEAVQLAVRRRILGIPD
jgi:hypothetical protein